MKKTVLYYDCFSGISGDMNLAALINLGVPVQVLEDELAKLGISGWTLTTKPDSRKGINGTRVDVVLSDAGPSSRGVLRDSAKPATGTHEHRSFKDICRLIMKSELSDRTKFLAIDMFTCLAEAEGKIHDTPPDDVHFHEVGALDSLIDMIGAAICIDYLHPDLIWSGAVELGGGFVNCQHGKLPVPVPAVTELLRNARIKSGAVPFETTTPTGAAILATLVQEWRPLADLRILKTGYGIGHRDTEIPNVLRVYWGGLEEDPVIDEPVQDAGASPDLPGFTINGSARREPEANVRIPGNLPRTRASLVECNLDDMNPESHGHLLDTLFAAGAQDAWLTPIVMKKSRSAVQLSVLCAPAQVQDFCDLVLLHTPTLGVRISTVDKMMLERKTKLYQTTLGKMNVKDGLRDGRVVKRKIEYEDLREAAKTHGLSIQETERQAWKQIDEQDKKSPKDAPPKPPRKTIND